MPEIRGPDLIAIALMADIESPCEELEMELKEIGPIFLVLGWETY